MTTPDLNEARRLADLFSAPKMVIFSRQHDEAAAMLRALADELERLRAQVAELSAFLRSRDATIVEQNKQLNQFRAICAAQAEAGWAVVRRWDSPDWKDTKHTADYIHALRQALTAAPAQQAGQAPAPAPEIENLRRDYARALDTIKGHAAQIGKLEQHIRELRAFQAMVNRYAPEFPVDPDAPRDVWYWQGDGRDHLESMVHQLPVVIRAEQLRQLLAASQAPAVGERIAGPLAPHPIADIICAWANGFRVEFRYRHHNPGIPEEIYLSDERWHLCGKAYSAWSGINEHRIHADDLAAWEAFKRAPATPAAEEDHDAWQCDRCNGDGWHWVEHEGVEWRDKVSTKEHCEQCDGLGWLGPDATKAAAAKKGKPPVQPKEPTND